jgi:hypothetical protein
MPTIFNPGSFPPSHLPMGTGSTPGTDKALKTLNIVEKKRSHSRGTWEGWEPSNHAGFPGSHPLTLLRRELHSGNAPHVDDFEKAQSWECPTDGLKKGLRFRAECANR